MPTMHRDRVPVLDVKPVKFPKYTGPKFQPIGELVHVLPDYSMDDSPIVTVGRVSNPKRQARVAQCLVLAVGPKVTNCKDGDVVLVDQHAGTGNKGEVQGNSTLLVLQKFVTCVIEPK